jgi:hypothetical protein
MAYGVIGEIIKNAVKIGNIPDAEEEIGHTHSVGIFYVPINIDKKQYSARLVIKELENKGRILDELSLYNVSLHKEKASSTLLNAKSENEAGQIYEDTISAFKVKDLIHSTQENDRKLLGLGEDFSPNFMKEEVVDLGDVMKTVERIAREERERIVNDAMGSAGVSGGRVSGGRGN